MSETSTTSQTTTDTTNVGVEGAPVDTFEDLASSLDQEGLLSDTTSDDSGSPEEGAEPEEETIELKVNGKKIATPLPEVIKMAQQYAATEQKLETAKREVNEARAMQQQIAGQQEAVRNLLGVLQRGDLETVAEFVTEHLQGGEQFNKAVIQYALKLYEQSKWSPEQREAADNRKLVTRLRQEAEQRQQQDQQRALEYKINQWSEHIAVEVPKALKDVGLPDTDFTREHVISVWRAALERGQNPTARAVANFVRQRLDEAKMLNQPAPQPQRIRPRATRESVGLSNGASQPTQYGSWDEWKANRKG